MPANGELFGPRRAWKPVQDRNAVYGKLPEALVLGRRGICGRYAATLIPDRWQIGGA